MKKIQTFYRDKNVLVTGGAGFIGSHIAQTLVSYKANVTILDDLSSGCIHNLEDFNDKIYLQVGDLTIFKTCMKATKHQNIVFHVAALASVPESIEQPSLCEKINTQGTNNLLEACKINNVKTFIFSSSAAIYGHRNNRCCENDKPNPQSPYAQSKLEGEKLCKEYSQLYNIKTASLRYFNVYGKRQNPNGSYAGVVAKFEQNLNYNQPITIYGNGKQQRDFIHVSKVVDANLFIATLPTIKGDIFNIATGKSITLLKLIHNLEQETKTKHAGLLFEAARSGDIFSSQANCEKYQTILSQLEKNN